MYGCDLISCSLGCWTAGFAKLIFVFCISQKGIAPNVYQKHGSETVSINLIYAFFDKYLLALSSQRLPNHYHLIFTVLVLFQQSWKPPISTQDKQGSPQSSHSISP